MARVFGLAGHYVKAIPTAIHSRSNRAVLARFSPDEP
jgi:hypothetical protein